MKFGEFKRMVLDETGEDVDTNNLFDDLFELYYDTDDVDLEDLKDYIENLYENTDIISEVADGLVDIYDSDLLEWYREAPILRLDYADDAIRELGVTTSIREILRAGQYLYLEELAYKIVNTSLSLVETLKKEVVEMERKTWKEFLEGCDVSGWKWSFLDRLDIVDETEDEYIVRLSLADITDDPYLEIEETENGETMINWGGNDWVVITDYDENHEIFIKIDKTRDPADNCFHSSDGNIYVDEYEK